MVSDVTLLSAPSELCFSKVEERVEMYPATPAKLLG